MGENVARMLVEEELAVQSMVEELVIRQVEGSFMEVKQGRS